MILDSKKAFIFSVVIKRVGVGVACKITWKVNLGYSFWTIMINDELKQSTVIKKGPRWVFHLFTEKKHGRHSGCPTIGLKKKRARDPRTTPLTWAIIYNSDSQNIVFIPPSFSAKIALMKQWDQMNRILFLHCIIYFFFNLKKMEALNSESRLRNNWKKFKNQY